MKFADFSLNTLDLKLSSLTLVVLYCIGSHSVFADNSQAVNNKHGVANIAVGESLIKTRAKLIRQGWQPIRMHAADSHGYSGVERELAAHKFFEVDACSFDSSRCILFYSRKGTCLRIDTIGEQLNEMTVTRWTEECPDTPTAPGVNPEQKHIDASRPRQR
ncbi:hypothetical protein ACP9OK_16760 [Pseudomonas sp. B11]